MWACVMPQEQCLALREEEPREGAWGRGEVGRWPPFLTPTPHLKAAESCWLWAEVRGGLWGVAPGSGYPGWVT